MISFNLCLLISVKYRHFCLSQFQWKISLTGIGNESEFQNKVILTNGFPIQIYGCIQCDTFKVWMINWCLIFPPISEYLFLLYNIKIFSDCVSEGEGEEVDNDCDKNEEASEGDNNVHVVETDSNRKSNNHIHRYWWPHSKLN